MSKLQVQEAIEEVQNYLVAAVDSEVELLYDASRHILTSGGKRVRPQVAFNAYLAAGGSDLNEVIPIAAAIELVHTATLVHDDINDHSMMRRGKPTVHSIWGRTFALLTGDYLFTKVYELMAPYGPEYNVVMSKACSELVEGETLQAAAAKAGEMDRETYKRIIALKTASLFKAAAQLGAMLATDDKTIVDAMTTYGYNLGLTFQIVDDILDIIGDPEEMGKPVGADVMQGRGVMAVSQNGMAEGVAASEGVATAVAEAVSTDEQASDPVAQMMASLRDSGAVDIARLEAQRMAGRARDALQDVPPCKARDELNGLIDLVLSRHS